MKFSTKWYITLSVFHCVSYQFAVCLFGDQRSIVSCWCCDVLHTCGASKMCWWVELKVIATLLAPPTSPAGLASPDGKYDLTINAKTYGEL